VAVHLRSRRTKSETDKLLTSTLDDIVRQKDPALKSAVELLATGQVSGALDVLQQQGRVKEIPNQEERVRAIAKSYVESPVNTLTFHRTMLPATN